MDSIIMNENMVYEFPNIDPENLFDLPLGEEFIMPLYDDNSIMLRYFTFVDKDDTTKAVFIAFCTLDTQIKDLRDKIHHTGFLAYNEFIPYSAEAIQNAYDYLLKNLTFRLISIMLSISHKVFDFIKTIVTDPHKVISIPKQHKFYSDIIDISTSMQSNYGVSFTTCDAGGIIVQFPYRVLNYASADENETITVSSDEVLTVTRRNVGGIVTEYAIIPSILNGAPNDENKVRFYHRYMTANMVDANVALENVYDYISTYIEEEIHVEHEAAENVVCDIIRKFPNNLYSFEVFCNMIIRMAKSLNYDYTVELGITDNNEE